MFRIKYQLFTDVPKGNTLRAQNGGAPDPFRIGRSPTTCNPVTPLDLDTSFNGEAVRCIPATLRYRLL